eukprot:5961903-Amphidinium_carterae.1
MQARAYMFVQAELKVKGVEAAAKKEQETAKKDAREAAEKVKAAESAPLLAEEKTKDKRKLQDGELPEWELVDNRAMAIGGELSEWELVDAPVGAGSAGATVMLSANTHVHSSFATGDEAGSVGLYANLHLHRSLSATNGAKMLVPMATDVQIAQLGEKFFMHALEPVTLRDGSTISPVVHCGPELAADVAFADPVWLCLPLPDGLQAFDVVVRECSSDVWQPLPEDDFVVELSLIHI